MNSSLVPELRQRLETYVAEEPVRLNHEGWWRKPLLVSSPVDQRFDVLPEIAMDEHLHPRDLLKTARSVIVFFIPFVGLLQSLGYKLLSYLSIPVTSSARILLNHNLGIPTPKQSILLNLKVLI